MSHQGRLRMIKCTKASTTQIGKHAIMATEQANITEAVVQVVAEAARVAVSAMAIASADNSQRATECRTQARQTHHEATYI